MKNLFAVLLSLITTLFPFIGVGQNKNNPTNPETIITRDDAKAIVLKHSGFEETEIRGYKIELDKERGVLVYEIEFDSGKYEYEYEVNAETGKVLKTEKEIRD